MLNPRDWFEIETVVDGLADAVEVEGRIAGIGKIKNMADAQNDMLVRWGGAIVLVVVLLFAITLFREGTSALWPSLGVIAGSGLALYLTPVVDRLTAKRRPLSPSYHRRM